MLPAISIVMKLLYLYSMLIVYTSMMTPYTDHRLVKMTLFPIRGKGRDSVDLQSLHREITVEM